MDPLPDLCNVFYFFHIIASKIPFYHNEQLLEKTKTSQLSLLLQLSTVVLAKCTYLHICKLNRYMSISAYSWSLPQSRTPSFWLDIYSYQDSFLSWFVPSYDLSKLQIDPCQSLCLKFFKASFLLLRQNVNICTWLLSL